MLKSNKKKNGEFEMVLDENMCLACKTDWFAPEQLT